MRKLANLSLAYVSQFSNLAFSFVTTPFLARVLNVDGYGEFALSVGINTALWIIVDWGFAMGSTKETARGGSEGRLLHEILWTTIYGKALVGAVALVGLAICTLALSAPAKPYLFFSGLLTILGAILNVDWLAVSLSKFSVYTLSTFAARLTVLVLFVCLVRSPSDAHEAAIFQGLSYTIVGVVGLSAMARYVSLAPAIVEVRRVLAKLLENSHYCFNRGAALAYVSVAPIIINMRAGTHAVGIYSGADKIVRIILTILTPTATIFFPYINRKMAQSRHLAAEASGVFFVLQFLITFGVALALAVTATTVVPILFGSRFSASARTLMILSPYPMLSCLSSALANQFAIPLGHKGNVSAVTFASAVLYTVVCFALVGSAGADGAAWALLVGEGSLLLGMFAFLWAQERDYVCEAFQLFRPKRLWTWVLSSGLVASKRAP